MPFVENLGTGGGTLDAQYGSAPTTNSNAPLLLEPSPDNFVYLPGIAGNYVAVPDSEALDITGDIDIRVRVAMDDWTPAATGTLVSKWTGAAAGNSFYLNVTTTGALLLSWTQADTTLRSATSTVTVPAASGIADGGALWIRATLDVDNAGQSRVQFFFAADVSTVPSAWTQIGANVDGTSGVTNIVSGSGFVEIGTRGSGTLNPAAGKFYHAQIRNGIGGTVVLDLPLSGMVTTGSEVAMLSTGPGTPTIPEPQQYLPNIGWGGSALNARYGSGTGVDSNDPRLLTHDGTNYVYLPGVAGNYMSVPDEAAFAPVDIDVKVRLALDDYTPSGSNFIVGTWEDSGNNRSWYVGFDATTGRMRVAQDVLGDLSAFRIHTSTASPTVTDGVTYWFRWVLDTDNGASGTTAQFYVAPDTGSNTVEPSSWTQVGTDVVTAGTRAIYDSTRKITIGGIGGGFLNMYAGKTYAVKYTPTINAAPVLDVDTSVITSGAATSFPATTGQTVTIVRSTSGRKSVAVTRDVMLFGTDDYLDVPDNDLIDFGASDSFTVALALRQWATPANSGRYISKGGGGTPSSFIVASSGTTQATQFRMDGAGGSAALATGPTGTSGTLRLSTAVRDTSADNVRMYLDGASGTPVTDNTTGTIGNASSMRIGSDLGAVYQDFELFGVAVFRRALSASEIATLNTHYQSGPTTAGTALLREAVLWLDPSQRKAATINRSTSGRKSVACARCVWLLGTDDFFEVVDSPLLDMGAGQGFTALVIQRPWNLQGASDTLMAKTPDTTTSTQGWAVSNPTTGDALRSAGRIGDGSTGAETFGPQRVIGKRQAVVLVRSGGTITAWTGGTAGTPTAATSGDLTNTSVMRIGRLAGAGTEYLDGEIEAAAVWRRALTTSEIAAVLNYYGAA